MIGIFDSGIGGVTVFKEILKELSNYKYIYYSDSLNNPYGDKKEEDLKVITLNICKYLVNRGCKIIVIACNTASAICKDYLREKINVPIIAIEPAIKMVYDNNYQGKTLIMATSGTINSLKFKELFKKYDNHNSLVCKCVGLADLIEEGKKNEIDKYLENTLGEYKDIENVVLGCTHYPLIKNNIKKVLGNVKFYDGSKGIVKELKRKIEENHIKEESREIEFIDSKGKNSNKERFWHLIDESSWY